MGRKTKPATRPEWTVPKYMIDEGDPSLALAYEAPRDPETPDTPTEPEVPDEDEDNHD